MNTRSSDCHVGRGTSVPVAKCRSHCGAGSLQCKSLKCPPAQEPDTTTSPTGIYCGAHRGHDHGSRRDGPHLWRRCGVVVARWKLGDRQDVERRRRPSRVPGCAVRAATSLPLARKTGFHLERFHRVRCPPRRCYRGAARYPAHVRDMPAVEVRAEALSPTRQRAAGFDERSVVRLGARLAPLEGDDFQSLLPLLPGIVRGTDGRLRVKGGEPTQGRAADQQLEFDRSSIGRLRSPAAGTEASTPSKLLANPFAAEYGRFSSSITQIQTRRGTNEWEFKTGNLFPRFRLGCSPGIRVLRTSLFDPRPDPEGSRLPRPGFPVSLRLRRRSRVCPTSPRSS